MRLTIVNLLISGANGMGTDSASILARMPGKLNPPYAGRRTAADAAYKISIVKEAGRLASAVVPAKAGTHTPCPSLRARGQRPSATTRAGDYGSLLSQGRQILSHRHFAVPHRRAGGEAFGRVDDGVGIDAVVAVEVIDRAGLAEMLDAERLDTMPAHAAEPAERRGMTVDHGDDATVARQRRQQFFDMAEWQPAAVTPHPARRGPPRMQPVCRRDRKQADIPAAFANETDGLDRLRRNRAGIGDHSFTILAGLAQPIGAIRDALLQGRRHHALRLVDLAGRKPQINRAALSGS